jgi:D-glycero-D-manno-heptose 1,7-bisphosphate phosphatase
VSGPRNRAAFLDRDGTIIVEKEYLADPAGIELVEGALRALRLLYDAGFALIIVTNQSGIARGLYSESDFRAVQHRLNTILEEQGVPIAGVYFCPHHPDYTGPCDCRKPLPGMFEQAANEHELDLSRSVYIGDRLKDVQPALLLGGLGILVRTGYGAEQAAARPPGVEIADDLLEAAQIAQNWAALS